MKTYLGIGQLKRKLRKPILTIGIFDGVHLGHKYIIDKVVKNARKTKGTSIVFTFYPHPYHVLKPREYLPLLISLEHRLRLLEKSGVDVCVVQEFTEKFSKIQREDFIKNIIFKKISPLKIFVGEDFNFGKNKTGDISLLEKFSGIYNYKLKEIKPRTIDGKVISSTFIRSLILKGKLNKAARFLGRPVSIFGKIVKGSKRGENLGFPTANIDYKHEVLPPKGVYAARIRLNDKKFLGVANIGIRPTFKNIKSDKKLVVEVHIFNFKRGIYGKNVEVDFIKRIRNEKKFKNRAALISQIKKDRLKTKQIFRIR